jgi:hypothetical protein
VLANAAGGDLRICAVGGGPGTELLGIAKHLLRDAENVPRKITFTVTDGVTPWVETWDNLAEASERELCSALKGKGREPPMLVPHFLSMDVVKPQSYRGLTSYFNKADIIVFNYVFSENKTRIKESDGGIAISCRGRAARMRVCGDRPVRAGWEIHPRGRGRFQSGRIERAGSA